MRFRITRKFHNAMVMRLTVTTGFILVVALPPDYKELAALVVNFFWLWEVKDVPQSTGRLDDASNEDSAGLPLVRASKDSGGTGDHREDGGVEADSPSQRRGHKASQGDVAVVR